jgi:hypothetical protein
MTPRFRQARFALAVLAALATGNAFAALTTFFGEDDAQGVMLSSGNAINAKNSLLDKLVPASVQTEGFETFSPSTASPPISTLPLTLFSAGSGISLASGIGGVTDVNSDSSGQVSTGRFNTTSGGTKWWETNGSFTITFANAINAFGMYGTDWGDFGGSFSLTLTDANDQATTLGLCGGTQDVVNACGSGATSGTLSFFGFTDPKGYKSITFNISSPVGSADYFGFDDLVIGDLAAPTNNVPEPATLALAGLGLAGLAASRRKRRG